MENFNQLQSIKVTYTDINGDTRESFISHDQFKTSFVEERWEGERRTQKKYTIFGYYHTKTTVTRFDGAKSVRTFDFPYTHKEAQERHDKATQA